MSFYTRKDVTFLLETSGHILTDEAKKKFQKALLTDEDVYPHLGHRHSNMMPVIETEEQ